MCCFSQPVELVADTNIFARGDNDRQFLVYSMSYAASAELAMVLPLPVPPNSSEDSVHFINLQGYPNFFSNMSSGFITRMLYPKGRGAGAISLDAPKIRVHDVGDFEASFVPKIGDFNRLDERFRIPPDLWDRVPAYHDYGFAVFKLKASSSGWFADVRQKLFGYSGRKPRRVHPMAFSFPRRNPELLYFPTVHVHDRKVHPYATFDHMLYLQIEDHLENHLRRWEMSIHRASAFMDVVRSEGIVASDQYCWRFSLNGRLQNKDTLVDEGGMPPE